MTTLLRSTCFLSALGLLAACGSSDDVFSNSDPDGGGTDGSSGGTAGGSGGSSGASGAGGGATGGAAGSGVGGAAGAGGSTGGSSGSGAAAGSGGSSGSGAVGGSGGASGSGGSAGTGGASGSGGSAGTGGSGGTGGGSPTCHAGSRPSGVLLHTTLDDAASITTPAAGDGTGSAFTTTPVDDFVPALIGNGIRLDAPNEDVGYRQRVGTTANVNFQTGAIDFCYRPGYAHTDGVDHALFGSTTFGGGNPGGIRIRKAGASNTNHFQVIYTDSTGAFGETGVPPTSFSWTAGQWVRVTVSWDFTVGASERNIRVFFDGVEASVPPATASTGPASMPMPATDEFIVIGSFRQQTWNPDGVIDEFYTYGTPIVP